MISMLVSMCLAACGFLCFGIFCVGFVTVLIKVCK
jgi:hypothetical protein